MTPRDPDEVEQTLLPVAPPAPREKPAGPAPAADTPGPYDATLDTPVTSAVPVDPDVTQVHTARTAVPLPPIVREAAEINGDPPAEPTLLPSSAPVAPGTVVDKPDAPAAEVGATMVAPTGRTAGSGSVGPLGTDTAPPSVSAAAARPGASPSVTGTMVGRFALRGLHASGGLGEVFTARDTELNREVAVKRIKSHYADDPGSRSRFLSEATLTARLDHPGVVPVFGLVNDVRGRPCYAMRFIRGETLKDEIDRYHGNQKAEDKGQKTDKTGQTEGTAGGAPGAASAPAEAPPVVPRTVAFRHLLARFIATCQAIAYAHKKNIIHRDIKPANIMVGSFGETLVVDWGLAKCLDDSPDFERIQKSSAAAGFRHDPDATDLPSHMTSAGTAVGTPSYMAPEQAAGDVQNVGPRADVYALGATLFVILTGKAPVSGKTTADVLEHVRRGTFEPADIVNPDAPKPLAAVAQKAMALRQEDRYATALELAADVERWLSDEPVSCYVDPLPARLARWARRHPARVATGTSLLLAGVLAAAAIAIVYQQGEKATREEFNKAEKARGETAEALKLVTAQKEKTDEALRIVTHQKAEIETQKAKVEIARNAAAKRYEKALQAYGVLVRDVDKQMSDRPGLQKLRESLLTSATQGLGLLLADEGRFGSDRTLVAAYRQMGEVYQLLGNTPEAHKNLKTAVERARDVKTDAATDADKRAADLDLGRSLTLFAGLLMTETGPNKSDEALKTINEAVDLFTPYAADPKDTEALEGLGAAKAQRSVILMERAGTLGAIKDCDDALAIRKALAPQKLAARAPAADVERLRDYAASLDASSALRLRIGKTAEALQAANDSLAIREQVTAAFPDDTRAARERADAHARLGDVHFERGHVTAAAGEYRKGVDQLTALVAKDGQSAGARADLAAMYGRLGFAQLRLGEVEEALGNTKAGKELAADLQKADPQSAKALRDLALARERYGEALLAAGEFKAGLDEYTASEAALRPLRDADNASARGQLELARGLERIGDGSLAAKDVEGAIVAFKASADIRRSVYEKDPNSAAAKRDYATGLYKLAEAHAAAGRPSEADGFATRATDLFVELAKADPASAQAQREVALAYGKWGQVLAAGGHSTGALLVWQNALTRTTELAKVDGKNTQAFEDEAAAWERLAGFYAAIGNTDHALKASQTAVDKWEAIAKGVDAKTKAGRRRLALAMLRCGDISTEVQDFRAAQRWYTDAKKEASEVPNDRLLAPLAKEAAERLEYAKAVEAVMTGPKGAAAVAVIGAYAVPVQLAALQTVGRLALRDGDPITAYVCATRLAKVAADAKAAPEAFAAAQLLAGCAAARSGTDAIKKEYAEEAVEQLRAAVKLGFRNADALSEPEWDAVRKFTKTLPDLQKEIERLRDGKK